ncbi:MAG: hypothetical protein WCJ11_11410 [Methylococcaceae bacterium]
MPLPIIGFDCLPNAILTLLPTVKGASSVAENLNIVPAGADVGVTLTLLMVVFVTVAAGVMLDAASNVNAISAL